MRKIAILYSCFGLLACGSHDVQIKNAGKVRDCKKLDCLDVSYNLDSIKINKKIAQKKTLLVFTAWNMQHTTFLDSSQVSNSSIYDALKNYSIIVQYVDDKARVHANDPATIGDVNLQYEISNFNNACQPLYVIYVNGLPRCRAGYLGKKEEDILQFLNGCDSNAQVIGFGN